MIEVEMSYTRKRLIFSHMLCSMERNSKPFKSEIRKWICEQKYQASRKKSKWVPNREELVKSVHDAMKIVSVDLLGTGVTKCVLPDAVVHGTGNWSKQPSPLTKTKRK